VAICEIFLNLSCHDASPLDESDKKNTFTSLSNSVIKNTDENLTFQNVSFKALVVMILVTLLPVNNTLFYAPIY
jgi:hypothetical protein